MKRLAILPLLFAVGCEQPRTQMMIGVVTDIRAPMAIDRAQFTITRAKDGFIEQQVGWDLSGVPNMPDNLPGSYGVYSDGEELQLDIVLEGIKNGTSVVKRRAVLNLVEGKTLFFRMSLVAGCMARTDCLATQSCVEGVCRDTVVNALQLPEFEERLVTELTCNSGTTFIDTATNAPLPLSADADQCPGHLCLEGTCLKPPPPEEGTRVVTGTQFTTFVQPTRTTNVPANLADLQPRALVPNAEGEVGTFTTINGTGSADGTFVIPEVPKGLYYLNIGNQYYVTHSSSFDLTRPQLGRPDMMAPNLTTTLNFQNVTNLDPWGANDELEFFAADANTFMFDLDSFGPPIPDTATAITNYPITLQDVASFTGDANLIRNTDPFFALQLQARATPGGHGYKAASKIFAATPFTMTDGGTTNLNGSFTAIPQTNMADATFPTSAWDTAVGYNGTRATALHPMTQEFPGFEFYTLVVHGQPGGSLFGQFSATADYLLSAFPHGGDRSVSGMTFGIPTLPGMWATIVDIRTNMFVPVQLPGTTTPARLGVGMSTTALFTSASSTSLAPQMGPVREPRIDGHDGFGTPGSGISTTPTISWQEPTLGKPILYSVNVHRFTSVDGVTQRELVASFHTTATELVIPPGVLQVGESYALQIFATTTANPDAPFRGRFPDARATIATSLFVPTVQGGSGMGGVDPQEPPDTTPDAGTGGGGSDFDAAP